MDKRYHTSVTYGAGQYPYQHTVVYRVEEAFQVKAHAVFITLGDIFLRSLQGLVAASVRAEAKAVIAELPFIDRTQDLADGLLDYSVHHRSGYQADVSCRYPSVFLHGGRDSGGICPISRIP